MPKKLLVLLLCLCLFLFPSFASAAEINLSECTDEELMDILRDAQLQLLIEHMDPAPILLYDDEKLSLYYCSYDAESNEEYVYLNMLLSNKIAKHEFYSFYDLSMNTNIEGTSRHPHVSPQSSQLVSLYVPREGVNPTLFKVLENFSLKLRSSSMRIVIMNYNVQ